MRLTSGTRSHARVEVLDQQELPIILIVLPGGSPWDDWTRFARDHQLGIAAQRAYARSIGALLDFAVSQGERYQKLSDRHRLLQSFAQALVMGTISDGADQTQLFWLPKSLDLSTRIVQEITRFSDWLEQSAGVQALNPKRGATPSEQILFWCHWHKRAERSLLVHLKESHRDFFQSLVARSAHTRKRRPSNASSLKAFPSNMVGPLLKEGFKRKTRVWTELRDQMIVLLMDGGGLRLSECLHLWINDVLPDPFNPDLSVVRVYHPSDGLASYRDPHSKTIKHIARAAFLRLVYDRVPLTDIPGQRGVGWKNPLLQDSTDKYLQVFWIGDEYSKLFLTLYKRYCTLRPRVSKHPYLFITSDLNPVYVRSFEKNYATAVRRIGMNPGKRYGTSPHGHRHAYGQRLRQAGLDPKIIQVALHHRSVTSQEIYTEPSVAEVHDAMAAVSLSSNMPLIGILK